jgi:hypothetical protein
MTDGEGLLLQADDKEYPMSNGDDLLYRRRACHGLDGSC